MRRNSTTLYLESLNAVTPVPWVNNAPDFSVFADPTLSVLLQSWADFLASGQELEVIPDPVQIVLPPEPLWDQFLANFFLPGNPLYNATATKVQASSPFVIEHWTNMKLGLQNSTIRSEPWLQLTYGYLKQILANEGNAITPEIEQAWVDMASLYNINLIPN